MPSHNAKIKLTIASLCITVFVILVGWSSSFITSRVNSAKIEQKVNDTVQSHTFWIEKLEEDVEVIKKDTSAIKEMQGRYDERLKGLEKGFDKIDGKLDRIWEKVK